MSKEYLASAEVFIPENMIINKVNENDSYSDATVEGRVVVKLCKT